MNLEFSLNGEEVSIPSPPGHETLLGILRDYLNMKGTKEGCGVGECGACTTLVDDEPVNACLTPAWKVSGRKVTTIEGLGDMEEIHPIQRAFAQLGAIQCGFCTPGMIMSTLALLKVSSGPDEDEIKAALSGNLCRCTGYKQIIRAVKKAADDLAEAQNGRFHQSE
jgi:carbon-monoxide dehydrogenase small subunit